MGEESRINMLEQQMATYAQSAVRMEQKIDAISTALQTLVRIEERQLNTSARLAESVVEMHTHSSQLLALRIALPDNLDTRLSAIEAKMPGLVEMRRMVVAGVLGGVGMVAAAIANMVIK